MAKSEQQPDKGKTDATPAAGKPAKRDPFRHLKSPDWGKGG